MSIIFLINGGFIISRIKDNKSCELLLEEVKKQVIVVYIELKRLTDESYNIVVENNKIYM